MLGLSVICERLLELIKLSSQCYVYRNLLPNSAVLSLETPRVKLMSLKDKN